MKVYFTLAALLIAAVLPVATLACSHNEPTKPSSFGIYLVDTGELIISDQHIQSYNASSFEIELNEEGIEQWNSFVASHDPEGTTASSIWCLHDKKFSVRVGEEEVYQGRFMSAASSYMYFGEPTICYFPELSSEFNKLWISLTFVDPRGDSQITDFFESEGLLE